MLKYVRQSGVVLWADDGRTNGRWVKPRRDMVRRRRLESEHIQEDDHLDGWPPCDVNLCWNITLELVVGSVIVAVAWDKMMMMTTICPIWITCVAATTAAAPMSSSTISTVFGSCNTTCTGNYIQRHKAGSVPAAAADDGQTGWRECKRSAEEQQQQHVHDMKKEVFVAEAAWGGGDGEGGLGNKQERLKCNYFAV